MTAPARAEMLRQLRCEHRVFVSVREAMVWFSRYGANDSDAPANDVRVCASLEAKEKNQNTYALLLLALRPAAPDIDNFNLHHIGKLADWHCAYTPQKELAKDWGFPGVKACASAMRFTEGVLENRLKVRGLLVVR